MMTENQTALATPKAAAAAQTMMTPTRPIGLRWLAHAAIAIMLPALACAQPCLTPTLIAEYPTAGNAEDIAIVGDTAYVADGANGVLIFDVSRPNLPALIGLHPTRSNAVEITMVGTTAYIADSLGFQIVDMSNRLAPVVLGSFSTPGVCRSVAVVGTTVFAAAGGATFGLQIVDVSDPASPTLIGQIGTPGYANSVRAVGTTVYLADGLFGLEIFDVSNPALPFLQGQYDTPGYAHAVEVDGTNVYVADYKSGLHVIDASDLANPALISSYDTPGYAVDVSIEGTTACVADAHGGTHVFDIGNPQQLLPLGNFASALNWGVTLVGDIVYVMDYDKGMQIVDVTNTCVPACVHAEEIGSLGWVGATTLNQIEVQGTTAYVSDTPTAALRIIDITDPTSPTALGLYQMGKAADDFVVTGNIAYVAAQEDGLLIVDVSVPSTPVTLGSLSVPGRQVQAVAVQGTTAYIGTSFTGSLMSVDVSNPAAAAVLWEQPVTDRILDLAVVGTTLYAHDNTDGLMIFDASDPASPVLLGTLPPVSQNFFGGDLVVIGTTAYICSKWGLHIIDVSNPAAPALLGLYDTLDDAHGVFIDGTIAHVASRGAGLRFVDITDPTNPTLLGWHDTSGSSLDVSVVDDVAYLATTNSLRTIDVGPCVNPCYADCDTSTGVGVLDIFDFLCFQDSFVNSEPYACDCDTSTGLGVCDIFDFLCFQNAFVGGCP